MTIYVDIIFLENIGMNYIILLATGLVCKTNIKHIRLLLASSVGALYAITTFLKVADIYSHFLMKVLLSIVMIYIAFQSKGVKVMCKQVLLFYLTSFVFGGCAFALLYFVRPQDILMRNGVLMGTYPIKIAILGATVGFVILTIAFRVVKSKRSKKDYFCSIVLNFAEKQKEVLAMIDTGNMLKDPISQRPVVVVERQQLYELLPKVVLDNVERIIGGDKNDVLEQLNQTEAVAKLRMIPFSSLGKQNGMLLGFKIDNMIIKEEQEEVTIENVIVGIYPKSLTKNGSYTALIGLEMLESNENKQSKREIQNVIS